MPRKKKVDTTPPSAHHRSSVHTDWTIKDSVKIHNRWITPGMVLTIKGEQGTFRFIKYVERPNGVAWIDVIGGRPGFTAFRSFRPERVKRVPNGQARLQEAS